MFCPQAFIMHMHDASMASLSQLTCYMVSSLSSMNGKSKNSTKIFSTHLHLLFCTFSDVTQWCYR